MGSVAGDYDFIIVGGGTAGCLFAFRLAQAHSAPSILLLEAGTENLETQLRIPAERYTTLITSGLDRGYVTVPQKALDGREIAYFRGQGLGGTSAVNFMQFSKGSSTDYNEWARLVGDDAWKWESTKERFKRLENHHDPTPEQWKKYAHSNCEDHGYGGPIDVSLPTRWENDLGHVLDAAADAGYRMNPDHNSGDIMGWSVSVSSMDGKTRTTSASGTIHNRNRPKNITVRTNAVVAKVMVESGVAVGVLLLDGTRIHAKRDVILSAGPLDTPKLLLLSGIGPSEELSANSIPIVHHLPGVGKHLHDHYGVFIVAQHSADFSDRTAAETNTSARTSREQWLEDRTGFYTDRHGSLAIAYLRDENLLETTEFRALDAATKEYLTKKEVPHYQLLPAMPSIFPGFEPDADSVTHMCCAFVHSSQASGSVTLRSNDPKDPPLIDLDYLVHPYDRQVLIRAVRSAMQLTEKTRLRDSFQKYIFAPASDSDEDILAFCRPVVSPEYHANGSAKMGKEDDPTACVDSNFAVYGVKGLRVVDLSVCPLTPNAHTQGVAYVIAETAAEKMIAEYGL